MGKLSAMLLALVLAAPFPVPPGERTAPAAGEDTPRLIISAAHPYGYEGTLDEAVQVANASTDPITLGSGWQLADAGNRRLAFPHLVLAPGERVWVAKDRDAFARQFGFTPTLAYADLAGSALVLANDGGAVRLISSTAPLTTPVVNAPIDAANSSTARWDAGSKTPFRASMERVDAGLPNAPGNWETAALPAAPAVDAAGRPITGTPRGQNTAAVSPAAPSTLTVVINEVAWSGTPVSPTREWIELLNTAPATASLAGWKLVVRGTSALTVSLAGEIAPGGYFLIQRYADTFGPGIAADLTSGSLQLRDDGAVLTLISATLGTLVPGAEEIVDTLVYGNGAPTPGWSGPPALPYLVAGSIPLDGQVLARKLDPATGLPAADTDTAQDWLGDPRDPVAGRRPVYPGWDLERFAAPIRAASPVTLAVTPDAGFDVLSRALGSAVASIDAAAYTFEQPAIADLLRARSEAGVTVRILLDGSPAGGLTDQARWACQRVSTSSNPRSGCWFMRSDAGQGIRARYANLHSKFILVDRRLLVVGSENLGPNGFPNDDQSDGTAGHRGALAIVESPALVERAQAIFDADLDAAHRDIAPWCEACAPFGPPAPGFTPVYTTGGISYTARFAAPLYVAGPVTVELATSPENNLSRGGILEILNAAGPGDELLAEQLDEPPYWGTSASNPADDPNPRLEALIAAARRGASVRLLLDRYYDTPSDARSNRATVDTVAGLARAEGLDLRAAAGDPAHHGIHNKMFLARIGTRKVAQLGSWNGSEVSAKRNREMTLLIESGEVHDALRRVFFHDFWMSQPVFVPLVTRDYAPPPQVRHLLISEVLFNPAGADEAGREWIEIVNPAAAPASLAGYKIGDAEAAGRNYNEGMLQFPAPATLAAGAALVVAGRADLFRQDWGRAPDFELADYDPAVPELLSYTAWSTGTLSLGNAGDQVVLLGPDDWAVDAVVWGAAVFTGTLPFTGALAPDHTLQRWPPDRDTDDCAADFRDQAIPSPGTVP